MTATGQCRCGAIRYEVSGDPVHHALCHCTACRRSAGAPAVSWALFSRGAVTISGEPRDYLSSPDTHRQFCGTCGTGLFYVNETIFPGMIDIQSATLDDPDAFPLGIQIQTADRIGWMERVHELPQLERYPAAE